MFCGWATNTTQAQRCHISLVAKVHIGFFYHSLPKFVPVSQHSSQSRIVGLEIFCTAGNIPIWYLKIVLTKKGTHLKMSLSNYANNIHYFFHSYAKNNATVKKAKHSLNTNWTSMFYNIQQSKQYNHHTRTWPVA